MKPSSIILSALISLTLLLTLVLYLAFNTTAILAFVSSFVTSAIVVGLMLRVVEVEAYEYLLIRWGGKYLDTGITGGRAFHIRGLESAILVDMRPHTELIADEECLTQDGVDLQLNHFLLWRVANPLHFKTNSPPSLGPTLRSMASTALQRGISKMKLQDVLAKRDDLEHAVSAALSTPGYLQRWGIELVTYQIQSIELPPEIVEIQRARIRAAADHQLSMNDAQAFQSMKGIVGDDARLLRILKTLSETFGSEK